MLSCKQTYDNKLKNKLHQVGDLFELNVKLRCQKVKQTERQSRVPFSQELLFSPNGPSSRNYTLHFKTLKTQIVVRPVAYIIKTYSNSATFFSRAVDEKQTRRAKISHHNPTQSGGKLET
jgi:hypothetical protein